MRAWHSVAGAVLVLVLVLGAACHRERPFGPADRLWRLDDFRRLAATEGCGPLPRYGSPQFARMTDLGALDVIDPPGRPVAERMATLVDFVDVERTLLKRYAMACGDPASALAVATTNLELYARLLPLTEAFLATFPPDDPSRDVRLQGLDEMKEGVVDSATGAALMVRGNHYAKPLRDVGHRLGTVLATLRAALAPGALDGAIGNLDVPADDDDDASRRALREELRAALHLAATADAQQPMR
ncbi:MAG TPA: hypothetical protein VHE35_33690 [Kofleriaceae bacterium]|nr:hypothetical protein [Kofleriaceae bacterium]